MTNPTCDKTDKMLLKTESEIYEAIVPASYPFRQLNEIIDVTELVAPFRLCHFCNKSKFGDSPNK